MTQLTFFNIPPYNCSYLTLSRLGMGPWQDSAFLIHSSTSTRKLCRSWSSPGLFGCGFISSKESQQQGDGTMPDGLMDPRILLAPVWPVPAKQWGQGCLYSVNHEETHDSLWGEWRSLEWCSAQLVPLYVGALAPTSRSSSSDMVSGQKVWLFCWALCSAVSCIGEFSSPESAGDLKTKAACRERKPRRRLKSRSRQVNPGGCPNEGA